MLGIENYKFGQKNNWRRSVWNELARRTQDRRNARILYLAGPQDLDAIVAAQKGFSAGNMIAVEGNEQRAAQLRIQGRNTICANIADVLFSWPKRHDVHVINADFCAGLTIDAIDIVDAMSFPALSQSVAVINMQRGRDAQSNSVRTLLRKAEDAGAASTLDMKHRGFQLLFLHSLELAFVAVMGHQLRGGNGCMIPDGLMEDEEFIGLVDMFIQSYHPRFFSYKSGRVRMDSVVFQHPGKSYGREAYEQFLRQSGEVIDIKNLESKPKRDDIHRKAVAAVAVQSRRNNLAA